MPYEEKKRYKGLIITVAVIVVAVATVIWIARIIPGLYSKDNAQKLLSRNRDEFVIVAEYLTGYGQSSYRLTAGIITRKIITSGVRIGGIKDAKKCGLWQRA